MIKKLDLYHQPATCGFRVQGFYPGFSPPQKNGRTSPWKGACLSIWKEKDRLPSIIFQGQTVSFRGSNAKSGILQLEGWSFNLESQTCFLFDHGRHTMNRMMGVPPSKQTANLRWSMVLAFFCWLLWWCCYTSKRTNIAIAQLRTINNFRTTYHNHRWEIANE